MRLVQPVEHPEPFVKRTEMARILGVSPTTFDRMRKQYGIPESTWGRRVRVFQPSVVIAHLARRDLRSMEEAA